MQARVISADKEKGWIEVTFDMHEKFCHALGLQGGLIAAMLDNAMARVGHLISDGQLYPSTMEMKVSYFRPGKVGFHRAEGQLVRRGRSVAFLQGSLFNASNQLIAKATCTVKLIPIESVVPQS